MMYNFTKEELELIHAYMFGGSYNVSTEELYLLECKIQSMIEDYCQHQYHNTKISKHWMCDTCGKHCGYITAEQLQNDNQ